MSNNKPTLYAFSVPERGRGKKPAWTRIGAAWAHEKGNGFTLELEALPLNFDGRIVLTEPKADSTASEGEGADGEEA
jgi:hypothetical protein